jgi:hypothetical protein
VRLKPVGRETNTTILRTTGKLVSGNFGMGEWVYDKTYLAIYRASINPPPSSASS